jgi:hypothetical protein
MDKVQNQSNSECYTLSSKSFRFCHKSGYGGWEKSLNIVCKWVHTHTQNKAYMYISFLGSVDLNIEWRKCCTWNTDVGPLKLNLKRMKTSNVSWRFHYIYHIFQVCVMSPVSV